MKKTITTLFFIVALLLLCSCSEPGFYDAESSPSQTEIEMQSAFPSEIITPEPTVSPLKTPVPTQFVEPTYSPKPIPSDLIGGFPYEAVIISDSYNTILFGYADGEWLSHSIAADHCIEWIDFYGYDLYGNINTRPSHGLCEYLSGSDGFSVIADTPEDIFDSNGDYHLIINENEIVENTSRSPVSPVLLMNIPQEDMPEISPVKNTSEIQEIVQELLDNEYGETAPKASITAAAEVDIDNDGKLETVFNAHNIIYPRYFPEDDPDYEYFEIEHTWYSVVAIIESDGQLNFIYESYGLNFMEYCPRCEAAVIVDMDGDGRCEIILESDGWEWSETSVVVYDGDGFYWTVAYAWVS